MKEIADALEKIADTIAREIHRANSEAVLRDLLDIHAEALKLSLAIRDGIDVSIDAAEALIARYEAIPKV